MTDSSSSKKEPYATTVYLEREGEYAIDRVVEAVRTVPWSVNLLQLAWTAGPVTFVAMQGASWFGFGSAAAIQNVMFFVAYTLIAGLVGLVTSILYKATRSRKEAKAQANLTRVNDQLPDLIFSIRDQHLAAIDADSRRREAAGLLLRKTDLGPASIARAVMALTDNARLAGAAADIELYRRAGIHSRVQDIIDEYRTEIEAGLSALAPVAPDETEVLRERLRGYAPTPEEGVPRESNFIERVLAAMDEDRLFLMSLRDAEEMLILAFECITGREIPVLSFTYRGRWQVARLIDEVETARNRYRLAQARIYNRIKALSDRVSMEQENVVDTGMGQTGPAGLLEQCREKIDQHVQHLTDHPKGISSIQTDLQVALQIADSLDSAYRQARQRYAAFIRALQRWERQVNRYQKWTNRWPRLNRRLGIRLSQRTISFSDEAKLEVANVLARYFDRTRIRTRDQRVVKGRPGAEAPLSFEEVKRLAIQVALTLDPHIGLTRPEVQRAINSTNAIYLSGIEPGTSATTKAAWGAAMSHEIETDAGTAAERLALTLIRTYKVALDDNAIQVLHEQYGANLDRIKTMASSQESRLEAPVVYPEFRPALKFDARWKQTLERARRVVERPQHQGVQPGNLK